MMIQYHTLSEWDLARSHSDERLECDSAYFDQWRFRLRVVLTHKWHSQSYWFQMFLIPLYFFFQEELSTLVRHFDKQPLPKNNWACMTPCRRVDGQTDRRMDLLASWGASTEGLKLFCALVLISVWRLSRNLIIRTVTTTRGGIEGVLAIYGMRTQGAQAPAARESASSPSKEEADRDQDFHF